MRDAMLCLRAYVAHVAQKAESVLLEVPDFSGAGWHEEPEYPGSMRTLGSVLGGLRPLPRAGAMALCRLFVRKRRND